MSKKNPPPSDAGFGDFEEDFFNSGPAGWEEPAPPPPPPPVEDKKAVEARKADEERKAAEAKAAEEKRLAEEGKKAAQKAAVEARMAEAQRQAELEAEARRVARDLSGQATRVFRRKTKEELLAEEDAEDALAAIDEAPARSAKPARVERAASPTMLPPDEEPAPPPAPEPVAEAPTTEAPAPEPVPDTTPAAPVFLQTAELPAEDAETQVASAPYLPPEPPAPEPLPPAPAYVPASDEQTAWKEAVAQLAHEAGVTTGTRKVALLVAAAHLARTRCIDLPRARELIEEAAKSAKKTPPAALWRERAEIAAQSGDADLARESWSKLAAMGEADAGEAGLESARIVRESLSQDELARGELDVLARQRPEDPAVLTALLEVRRALGDRHGEADALKALAALYDGPAAAWWHVARAELHERGLNEPAEAAEAARSGLAADPSSGAAFQILDRQLRANGDWPALATLYKQEGARAEGAEAAWWLARAARVYRTQLLNEGEAEGAYRAGLDACPEASDLRHEYEVFCAETDRHEALAASLARDVAGAAPAAKAYRQFRLASVLEERLGRADEALALYREAAADPAAAPAAEAVLRLLQARGKWKELLAFLQERLGRLSDPALMVTVLYRMGETSEGPLEDQAAARQYYERILDVAPGYLPALEGLERVYHRVGAWPELAAIYEQRSILAEEPSAIALHRHRAGAVFANRLGKEDRAAEQYRLALEACPDFPPSLEAYVRWQEGQGDWAGLARTLRNAAAVARDANEAVSLSYRAGRVLADRTDDLAGAMACLQKCLDSSPGFLPAVLLLKELAARQGDWSEYFRLERGQADQSEDASRRHWRLFAAAGAAQRLPEADPDQLAREILREDAEHPGANDLAERLAIAGGDAAALIALYLKRAAAATGEAERVRACVRVAELAADQGDATNMLRGLGEVLGAAGVAGRPLRALARVAEAMGYPEDALRALDDAGEGPTADKARLRQQALGDTSGALSTLSAALEAGDDAAAALATLAIARDHASRGRAHAALSRTAKNPAVAAMHALQAAPLLTAAGLADEARAASQRAFDADPRPGRAFDAMRAALIAAKDGETLRALYARVPAASSGLGEALEEAGDIAGAVAAWRTELAASEDPLPWSLRIERGLTALGEWKGVFETLQARTAWVSTTTRNEIAAKCRWLLAEKLAETDEAWDFYRQLHEARPDDVEVLEALARIAGARGETALAVSFLDGLSSASKDPAHAARVQRRRAEVLAQSGDPEGARAAYTRALDYQSDDIEALAGLRTLAEQAGDWTGVVGVLARMAALATGREQVDRFAEIARMWEDKLLDRSVAADAWRKVLELAPEDPEALRRLVALSESAKDWAGFVEFAQGLLAFEEGEARSTLMRRIGVAYADHLRREEDAVRYLESAASGATPDAEATRLLERIYVGRGEWERVVDTLRRRAKAADSEAERVDALSRAARMRAETLSDRAGAAEIYEELLAIEPAHPEGLRFRSEVLWESGDHAGAVELFARMEPTELDRDAEDFDTQIEVAMFFFRFAEALKRLERTEDAVLRYQRALDRSPTHLPSLEAVGPMYMEVQDWARGERVFRQLLQLTGGLGNAEQLAKTYANLGLCEFRLGQIEKSRKRFNKALELRPNDVSALKGLGLVLASLEDWNNLLNVYNNVIFYTHDPGDVIEAYLQKGFVLDAKLNLADKAGQHYEKSLAFDPGQPLALLRLAEIALRRQDWPEAASLADRGLQLELDRDDVKAGLLLARAIAYQACGDGKAAQEGFKQATAADAPLAGELGGATIDDYEQVHEMLRGRIQSGRL